MPENAIDIFPPFQAFYIESMLRHSKSAIKSIEAIEDWMQIVNDGNEHALELDKDKVFNHLQNIIQQSGALSRFLWPAQKGENKVHYKRGLTLRNSLNITSESSLKNRALRNQVEHFDELLDIYLNKIIIGRIIPSVIDYDVEPYETSKHIFKAFYIHPMIFDLLGERHQLKPIFQDIRHMHTILIQCTSHGYRLPH